MFPVPINEAQRIHSLESYSILDTASEEAFDRLTELARRQFDAPAAYVSLIDRKRQWCKSHPGFDVAETSREIAFSSHVIASDVPLVILDTARDARFRCNPLVSRTPGIRFYAGAPLIDRQSFRLGSFSILDFAPRWDFPMEEIAELQDYAHAAMQLIELRRPAEGIANQFPKSNSSKD